MIASNITRDLDGNLLFAGQDVQKLADQYGTPLYLTDSDKKQDIPGRVMSVADRLKRVCRENDYPIPFFVMEPGRSIVADAGMTVYTAVNVKRIPGHKNYLITDGGMTDNPRYCLYGAKYTVMHTKRIYGKRSSFDIVGRCCESGDIIQPQVSLPDKTSSGDRIAVCTTGAYNYSMASNYNRFGRPPVVMLNNGSNYLAVKRESINDICSLDL